MSKKVTISFSSRSYAKEISSPSRAVAEKHDVFSMISSNPETNPTPKKEKSNEPVKKWVRTQENTFAKWVNSHLGRRTEHISDLSTDLNDGVKLIMLMESLTGKSIGIRYHKAPKLRVQQLENLQIAFDFMHENGINLVNTSAADVVDGNLKIILGLLWCLILHYQIAVVNRNLKSTPRRETPRKLLLSWFCSILPRANITNFTTSWNDGLNLSALVDYCKPGLIPHHANLSPSDALENITHAMKLAEEHFGIPQIISPQDLAVESPDERSVMTYLSLYCRPGSIGQQSLLDWVQTTVPEADVADLTLDWKDGKSLCTLVDSFAPGSLPPPEVLETQSPLERTKEAMKAAERKLGVEQSISAEDITNPEVNQLSVMSYLAQFQKLGLKPLPRTEPYHTEVVSDVDVLEEEPKLDASVLSAILDFDEADFGFTVTSHIETAAADTATAIEEAPSVEVEQTLESAPPEAYTVDTEPEYSQPNFTITGRGIGKACVRVPAEFVVECSGEDWVPDMLDVEVEAPTGEPVEAVHSNNGKGRYQVVFTPQKAGAHSIHLWWNDDAIPGSPFSCKVSDPQSCIASGAGLLSGVLGQKLTFGVSTKGAGPGSLSASVYGPGEPVELALLSSTDSLYTYEYCPQQTGTYIINIKWDGHHIPGSPFRVLPTISVPTPTGKVFVKEMPISRMCVSHPISIIVDTSEAGSGTLHAVANGPSMTQDVCEIAKVDESTSAIVFYPQGVGEYRVEISYNDTVIPDCPLDFTVNDPTKCQVDRQAIDNSVYQTNWPATFSVSTYLAGEGKLTGSVKGPERSVKCDITAEEEGNYTVTFVPVDTGKHTIQLFYDNQPVPNTPIEISVGEVKKPVDETDTAGANFTLPSTEDGYYLTDRVVEIQMHAPNTSFTNYSVTAIGVQSGAMPSMVGMIPVGDDTYNITFRATHPDDYKLEITYKHQRVAGTPLLLPIRSSPSPRDVVAFDPITPLKAGSPIELIYDTSQAGMGKLSAEIISVSGERLEPTITEVSPNLYSISFIPKESDIFTAHVNWAGQPVRHSPFKVTFKEQTREPTVAVTYEPNNPKNIITAVAFGQTTGQVDVDVRQVSRGKYHIGFSGQRDIYNLHVRCFNKELRGSPFCINLLSPPALQGHRYIAVAKIDKLASKGVLSACTVGKKVGPVPMELRPSLDGKHVYMTFTDRSRDSYDLYVFWNRQLLKGAPFTLNRSA